MDEQMLSGVERETLCYLYRYGNWPPSVIARGIGRHNVSVSKRRESLEEKDLIFVRGGTWSLTEDGASLAASVSREIKGDFTPPTDL